MRKLWLVNQNGEELDLNVRKKTFASELSGFGLSHGYTYTRVGRQWVRTGQDRKMEEPSFKLVLAGYSEYQDFLGFVERAESLRLAYQPLGERYYRDVDLESIDKTEIDRSGFLICQVKLAALSDYYIEDVWSFTASETGTWRWSFTWPVRLMSYTQRTMTIHNGGHVPGYLRIRMAGYAENPVIRLYVDNALAKEMPIPCTLQDGDILVYSGVEGQEEVTVERTTGEREDISQSLDLAADNFFQLPVGDSLLAVSAEDQPIKSLQVTMVRMMEGV